MKIGIIGTGYWGPIAQAVARHLPELRVDRVWSRRPERAQALAESIPGCRTCVDPDDLAGLELVVIATPPLLEPRVLEAAIDGGVPALVEKPVSLERGELSRLAARAERAGVPVAVHLQGRFSPPMYVLRDRIARGLLGPVREVDISALGNRGGPHAPLPHGWIHRIEDGGGVLGSAGPHAAELLLAVAGAGRPVFARAWTEVAERADADGILRDCSAPDNAEILTEHDRGARGRLRLGTTARKKEETWTVRCDDGTLRVDAAGQLVQIENFGQTIAIESSRADVLAPLQLDGHPGLAACDERVFPALVFLSCLQRALSTAGVHGLPDLALMGRCLAVLQGSGPR